MPRPATCCLGALPRRHRSLGADRPQPAWRVPLQFESGEPPALGPAFERHDRVRHPGGNQRLGTDDAAGTAGAGDHDQRVGIRHQITEPQGQLGAGAGKRTRDVKAAVFVERAAVEHHQLLSGTPPPVEFLGRDRRGAELMLDDLGEGLARHVGTWKQRMAGGRPGFAAAIQNVERAVAEPCETPRRLLGDPVAPVEEQPCRGTNWPISSSSRL